MSKYSEGLERILHHTTDTKNSEIKLLLEAISKAEKYDEIDKVVIGEGYATDDDNTDKEKVPRSKKYYPSLQSVTIAKRKGDIQ